MSKQSTSFVATAVAIENNSKTGRLSFQVEGGAAQFSFSLDPIAAIRVMDLMLVRLMQRQEEPVTRALQNFAIQEIEAKTFMDGRPYLQYKMENGLAFGSGLERDKLEALYHQLGDILGSPLPSSKGADTH